MQASSNNNAINAQSNAEKVLENDRIFQYISLTNPVNVLENDTEMGTKCLENNRVMGTKISAIPRECLENDRKSSNKLLETSFYQSVFNSLDIDDSTRDEYVSQFPAFVKFVRSDGGLHVNSFVNFKRDLASNNKLSPSTKNKLLTVARLFLKELHRRGLLPTDITSGVKGFRQSKKHKRSGLSQEDIDKIRNWVTILRAKRQPRSFERVLSILLLLTYHGLRQVEISRLCISDFIPSENVLFVLGKGTDDKQRALLHPDVTAHLVRYVKAYQVANGSLFFSLSNNSYGKQLSTRSINQLVKDVLNELCIERTVHGFRRFYTTRLLQEFDGDVIKTMKYTRHRSVEMMVVYNDAIDIEADKPRYDSVFTNTLVAHEEVICHK